MTKRRRFSLAREAERLYASAKAKGDFSGAASVLRLLRDLQPEQTAVEKDPMHIDVSKLSEEDFAELSRLMDALDAFTIRVNGLTTAPAPAADAGDVALPAAIGSPDEEEPFELGENEIEIELGEDEVLP